MSKQSAEAMKRIFAAVQPILREAGYRKSGSIFNRIIEPDGLVHVVEFQRSASIHTVPGERQVTTPYGGFTLNLGIWLPGVWQAMRAPMEWNDAMEGKVVSSSHCHLRERLGSFFPIPADYWWPVSEDGASGEVVAWGMAEYGLPWLAGFVSWDQILRQFEEGPAEGKHRVRLLAMCMRIARGQHDEAERDFVEHLTYLATKPSDPRLRSLNPDSSVVPFIESLERLAVAHRFTVDVQAYAAQARQRERAEKADQPGPAGDDAHRLLRIWPAPDTEGGMNPQLKSGCVS